MEIHTGHREHILCKLDFKYLKVMNYAMQTQSIYAHMTLWLTTESYG